MTKHHIYICMNKKTETQLHIKITSWSAPIHRSVLRDTCVCLIEPGNVFQGVTWHCLSLKKGEAEWHRQVNRFSVSGWKWCRYQCLFVMWAQSQNNHFYVHAPTSQVKTGYLANMHSLFSILYIYPPKTIHPFWMSDSPALLLQRHQMCFDWQLEIRLTSYNTLWVSHLFISQSTRGCAWLYCESQRG